MAKLKYAGEINAGAAISGASLAITGNGAVNGNLAVGGAVNAATGTFSGLLTAAGRVSVNGTHTTADGWYISALGTGGAARNLVIAGITGVSNGMTVQYDGSLMRYTFASGTLNIGDTVTAGASAGDSVHANLRGSRGVNGAGTATLPMTSVDTFGQTRVHLNGARLCLQDAWLSATVGAAGTASALPAQPNTYVRITIPGVVNGLIPVYNEP